jgi:hypothetical protein
MVAVTIWHGEADAMSWWVAGLFGAETDALEWVTANYPDAVMEPVGGAVTSITSNSLYTGTALVDGDTLTLDVVPYRWNRFLAPPVIPVEETP